MKKHFMILFGAVAMTLAMTSCSAIGTVGAVYTGTTTPSAVTGNKLGSKVGVGTNTGILGLVAFGDAGINTAAKSAGITRISHVDVKTMSILGIFTTQKYYVYGE